MSSEKMNKEEIFNLKSNSNNPYDKKQEPVKFKFYWVHLNIKPYRSYIHHFSIGVILAFLCKLLF